MKEETKINYTDVDSLFTYTGTDTSEEFYSSFRKSFSEIMLKYFPKGDYSVEEDEEGVKEYHNVHIFGSFSAEFKVVREADNILILCSSSDGVGSSTFIMVVAGPKPYENEIYGS